MTSKDFVIKSLDSLVKLSPNIVARYEDHKVTRTHFIEIKPAIVFNSDETFRQLEERITLEFISLFPEENISFIPDTALVGIDNVDYEAVGKDYKLTYSVNSLPYQSIKISQNFNVDIIPVISEIKSNSEKLANFTLASRVKFTNSLALIIDARPTESNEGLPSSVIENAGESNYAMAA